MTTEWFYNIPKSGILCKCKYEKSSKDYRVDVITRYNDHPLSDFKFRNSDKYYAEAIPLSIEEALSMIFYDTDQ